MKGILRALIPFAIVTLVFAASANADPFFVPNEGQVTDMASNTRPDIAFTSSANGLRLYLLGDRISYVFEDFDTTNGTVRTHRFDLLFIGARRDVRPVALDRRAERLNFYRNGRAITGVHPTAAILYRDIYPNVDLRFTATSSGYKYDFIVRPGGRVADIAMRYVGASDVALSHDGGVRVKTSLGDLYEAAPTSYIESDRIAVGSRFNVDGDNLRFEIADYDRSKTLVIDPTLIWGSYLGGTGLDVLAGAHPGLAVALDGSTTISGMTASTGYPTSTGAFQTSIAGVFDLVVTRIRRNGTLAWSTYLGGTSNDSGASVAVDAAANAYIAGNTASNDFPVTTGAHQTTYGGNVDATMTKLDSTGAMLWSSYFGGSSIELGSAVTVGVNGAPTFITSSQSSGLATTGAYRTTTINGASTVLLSHFDPSGQRVWATYYGNGTIFGVCSDVRGNIYAAGSTVSTAFPTTTGAFQSSLAGRDDAFVLSLDSNGRQRWSTFIGGGSYERGLGIIADVDSNVIVVGSTQSTDFPTSSGAFQTTIGGTTDGFATSFSSSGSMRWSTYFGAAGHNHFFSAATDASRDIIIVGNTTDYLSFPVTPDAFPVIPDGQPTWTMVRLSQSGQRLWSTYFSSGIQIAINVVTDEDAIMVAGTSRCAAPVTFDGYQPTCGGFQDLYIGRFCGIAPRVGSPRGLVICRNDSVTLTAPSYLDITWSTGSTAHSITVRDTGRYWYFAEGVYCSSWSDTVRVTNTLTRAIISPSGLVTFCEGDSVELQAAVGPIGYRWSSGQTSRTIFVSSTGTYAVAVLGADGCRDTTEIAARMFPRPRPVAHATPRIFCPGESATLELPSGFRTYEWSNGETARRIVVRSPGTYRYQVVDTNGCRSFTDSITVTQFPKSRITVTPASVTMCSGDTVTLTASTGPVRYVWSTGAATRQIVVTAAGTYSVYGIDSNGCRTDTVQARITMHPITAGPIVAGGGTTICMGDSVLLYSARRFRSYRWSTGDTIAWVWARRAGPLTLTVIDTNGCTVSATVTITVRDAPQVSLSLIGSRDFCEGGEATLFANGFSDVRWSNGASGPALRVRTSGSYWADVYDASGCRGRSDTVTITVHETPVASMAGPLELCRNSVGTYSVAANPLRSYRWSVLSGDGKIVTASDSSFVEVQWGIAGGSLRVIIENRTTGCRDTATVDVTIADSIDPAIATNRSRILCPGDSITLDAGGGYATYRWSNGQSSQRINVGAGRYAVWVATRDGCAGTSDSIEVSLAAPPTPQITPDGSITLCRGGSIVLSTDEYASYAWSTGATSRSITVTAAGQYSVVVRDANGCTGSSKSVTVSEFQPASLTIDGPTGACPLTIAMYCAGTAADTDFVWTITGGDIVTGQGTSCITVRWRNVASGTVILSAREATAGCTINSEPLIVDLSGGLRPALRVIGDVPCEGGSADIDAGMGYASYLWSTGETTRTITVRSNGVYGVDVSDETGCRGAGSIEVRFNALPRVAITASGPTAFCRGDSAELIATDGFASYDWSTGQMSRSIIVRESGSYRVVVMDASGCSATSAELLVEVFELPLASLTRRGDTIVAQSGAASYAWSHDGLPIPGASDSMIVASGAGEYRVRVLSDHGCSADSDPIVIRAGMALVALDTVSATVGNRFALTLRGSFPPALTGGYRTTITYNPQSLFLHDVTAVDALLIVRRMSPGVVELESPATTILDGRLAVLTMEGLATATPINPILLIQTVVPKVEDVVASDGLVLLSGCVIAHDVAFGRAITIVSVSPNPGSQTIVISYEAPMETNIELSMRDIAGREVVNETTRAPGGTGLASLDVSQIASGFYLVELRDGAERAIVPVWVIE